MDVVVVAAAFFYSIAAVIACASNTQTNHTYGESVINKINS